MVVVRRVPFTLTVVVVMLVLGVVTQTLWSGVNDRPLFHDVAYGLPAFQAGHWYSVVTGAFFALIPVQYVPVAGGFALLVGFAEWFLGTRRVAIVTIAGQAIGVLGAALLLRVLVPTGWQWAIDLSTVWDVGFSAGAIAAVAAATAALPAPWRGRLRIILATYCYVSVLYVGVLWDVEHAIAVTFGFLIGPPLVGRAYRRGPVRLSRHEWRLLAAGIFFLFALIRVVLYFVPADGPLGAAAEDDSVVSVLISAGISLLFAFGLRRGSRVAWRWALGFSIFVVAVTALGFIVYAIAPGPDTGIDSGGTGGSSLPAVAVDLTLWIIQLIVLVMGRNAFRSKSRRTLAKKGIDGTDDQAQAVDLLRRDGGTSLSWMTTWPANRWYFPPDPSHLGGEPLGYQAFQVHSGMAVSLGDPVAADAEKRAQVLDSFVDFGLQNGLPVCLFSVTDETKAWADQHGWRSLCIAEEAVIDLPDLEFKGKAWQDVRSALNRATKEGVEYRLGTLAEMPRGILVQVRAISEVWVSDKGLPEMGFTLGGVDEALDPLVKVGVAIDGEGTVHGVTSWLPVYDAGGEVGGWTLDVMRRLPDGFRPVTEYMIASACLAFKEAGCRFVSLSGAPLAHAGAAETNGGLDRLLGTIGTALEPVYGFQSLEAFKAKFQPRHRPVWMVYADDAQLPRIGMALTRAFLPDASLRELASAGLHTASF